jgi:2,3-bisphosphoglycerate-independent phosphoglycerate mutase
LLEGGALCDISPTLLKIMGLTQPDEMKGRSLIEFDQE